MPQNTIILGLFVALLLLTAPVWAEESGDFNAALLADAAKKYKDPNNIADIPDEVIIEDFINIAFSDHDWASDYPWYDGKEKPIYIEEDSVDWFDQESPSEAFLAGQTHLVAGFYKGAYYKKQLFPSEPLRPINRVNKIASNATFFVDVNGYNGLGRSDFWSTDEFPPYESEILNFLSNLNELTGVEFELPPSSRQDGNFVIYNDWPFFKDVNALKYREHPAYLKAWYEACHKADGNEWYNFCYGLPVYVRHAFKTATRFTPLKSTQVEGYFFSNSKNEITGGDCLIARNITLRLRLSLSYECMLRQLGLPGSSILFKPDIYTETDRALLGQWAIDFPGHDDPVVPSGRHLSKILPEFVYFGEGIAGKSPLAYANYPVGGALELTDYDKLILRILYDPRIKPGMTVAEARAVLPDVVRDVR